MEKEDILKYLKWYRDDYQSPKKFSSFAEDCMDESARICLTNMLISFLETGDEKLYQCISKHEEDVFFPLIKRAELLYKEKHLE